MASKRIDQLQQEYRKEIADIISNLKTDGISGLVSIMSVDVSPDLKHARVYVSVFQQDEEKRKLCFTTIVNNAKTVRRELSRRMTQRTVPELTFLEDDSMSYSEKINRILQTITPTGEREED